MAHEITQDDQMISVLVEPWHGLGIVLPEHPTVWEAADLANLRWEVTKSPVMFKDLAGNLQQMKNRYAVVRNDTNAGLGIVTNKYEPLQNDQMWSFIESFVERSGSKIETAGSLMGGKKVWVLCTDGQMEYVSGDPVKDYFLFVNGHDGATAINCLFTKVRVVCHNTWTLALSDSINTYVVRHTRNATRYLQEVDRALGFRTTYNQAMAQAMGKLIQFPVAKPRNVLEEIWPRPEERELAEGATDMAHVLWSKKLDRIVELAATGAGTDIPGVRGTAYGLLQAVGEYADHEKLFIHAKEADPLENRFRSVFWGSAAKMKQEAYDFLMKRAA